MDIRSRCRIIIPVPFQCVHDMRSARVSNGSCTVFDSVDDISAVLLFSLSRRKEICMPAKHYV